DRCERAIAPGRGALRTGLLHRVGRVEADRCEPPHHDEPAHVHHQRVIAEGGPPLGEQDLAASPLAQLVYRVLHVFRSEELSFLDVDGASGRRRGQQQIRLPAEERGDLQDVHHLGGRRALGRLVDVGEHGQADLRLDPGEDAQAFLQPRAAERLHAGPIRLVEAALEDDRNPVLLRHLRHLVRVPERELLPLDHAGPGDRDQLTAAEFHALATGAPAGSTISGAVGVAGTEIPLRTRCSSAALTNPAKSGCAWNGLLWNSGWYWQPMKYGCPCSSITSTSPSCSLTPLATSPFSSSCAR